MKIIYPGTFDPFSLGHLDLVSRAVEIYDHLIIAISENARKHPMFSLADRVAMAKMATKEIENVSVVGFQGLLVELMRQQDVRHVLRGIRGMVDFEYEFQMAQVNRNMLVGYEPVFLMPSEKYMVLSSTIIREVALYGGDVSNFLPQCVYDYIMPRINHETT
ncbi:MAG: pantetheine-phosphate adenylyltransferase [Deferribacteraceae bacterium]|jgi:pantetheine-phosphate adenylyltransferase|nr:pantetheine-phosphate adenylyltransferase [Deferribacteraceae bacterium]